MLKQYKKVKPGTLLVVTGKLDPKNHSKFILTKHGRIFVWPVIQDSYDLDISNYVLKDKFSLRNGKAISIDAQYDLDTSEADKFVDRFLSMDKSTIQEEILRIIKVKFENYTLEDLDSTTQNMKARTDEVNQLLFDLGLGKPGFTTVSF